MSRVWTPRPDQQALREFMRGRNSAAIWSSGGSGKTAITCDWLVDGMFDRFTVDRAVVVAPPLVARDGWPAEIAKWENFRQLRDYRLLTSKDFGLVRPDKRGGLEFEDKAATKRRLQAMTERLHVVPWSMWPWLVQAYGRSYPYDATVYDEASTLGAWSSTRTTAARFVQRHDLTRHVLELTASPAANHEDAVFAQLYCLGCRDLGATLTEFHERYCEPGKRDWRTGQVYSWSIRADARERFDAIVATWAVSVPSALKVPRVDVDYRVPCPDNVRQVYDDFVADQCWEDVIAGSEAQVAMKIRQIASGFLYGPSGTRVLSHHKTDRLEEILEGLGGPAVVAFEWTEQWLQMKARLKDRVRDLREPGAKQAFMAGKLPVLALQLKSGGHGVDGLQEACNHLVWLSPTWDNELWEQVNWRVHRNGTTAETVYIHTLLTEGTFDERVYDEVLPGKRSLQDALLDVARK